MERPAIRLEQRFAERFAECRMRVNQAGRIMQWHMIAHQLLGLRDQIAGDGTYDMCAQHQRHFGIVRLGTADDG